MGRNAIVLVHASSWRAVAATRASASTCMQTHRMGFTFKGVSVHKRLYVCSAAQATTRFQDFKDRRLS